MVSHQMFAGKHFHNLPVNSPPYLHTRTHTCGGGINSVSGAAVKTHGELKLLHYGHFELMIITCIYIFFYIATSTQWISGYFAGGTCKFRKSYTCWHLDIFFHFCFQRLRMKCPFWDLASSLKISFGNLSWTPEMLAGQAKPYIAHCLVVNCNH